MKSCPAPRWTRRVAWPFLLALWTTGGVVAQAPGEVTGLAWDDKRFLSWDAIPGAEYDVVSGPVSWLRSGVLLHCAGDRVGDPLYEEERSPPAGQGYFYVVSAFTGAGGSGTPGVDSMGAERWLGASCATLQRRMVERRLAYGSDEWSRDRIALLGLQGYVDEQLDPASIDESTNVELASRRAALEPPETIGELRGLDLVNAVYARRQLEQRMAMLWANHFNTDYAESNRFFNKYRDDPPRRRLEATRLHHEELERFRSRAFAGNFRQLLEDSALSPAMVLYLDTDNNVAGRPNENYARELLELHTMGVDGGYTHHEIDNLARVMTGWNVCKKPLADAGDYLTGCIPNSLIATPDEPDGVWVTNFRQGQHDCGEKTLFVGTLYETVIPDTCASPRDGVNDVFLALDALAAHPSTAEFVSSKLLQHFVTDQPTDAMVAAVVSVWNDPTHPYGVGDLREVLRAVLSIALAMDEEMRPRQRKIKTPFEQMVSAFRAIRGQTNGIAQVGAYLRRMQQLPHQNPIPTGYPEIGNEWIDTNGVLERQNFGMDLAGRTGVNFGGDIIGLLQDNGVSTTQGNAPAIVDFFLDVLFGGAHRGVDRQAAIEYLETDDSGVPASYTNARIRETVGFLMGCPEFFEQ